MQRHEDRVRERADDLALRSSTCASMKSARRSSTCSSVPDASPARDHVHVERGKTLGAARAPWRSSCPRSACSRTMVEHALQLLVLDLLDQRAERLDERDARANERGELPRDASRRRAATAPEELRRSMSRVRLAPAAALLLGRDGEQDAVAPQSCARRTFGFSASRTPATGLPVDDDEAAVLEDGHGSPARSTATSSCGGRRAPPRRW